MSTFCETCFKNVVDSLFPKWCVFTLFGTCRRLVGCVRWFRHVGDPIWSVRDDSATALGAVCKAYGEEAYEK